MLFPEAAVPPKEVMDAAVATALVSEEYVYLFLIDVGLKELSPPTANIPLVLFPAAVPAYDDILAEAADALLLQA